MSEAQKVSMSPEWTDKERAALAGILDSRISELEKEDRELRKTIKYEAPCFMENAAKRDRVDELRTVLKSSSPSFLENNRSNFSEFITD